MPVSERAKLKNELETLQKRVQEFNADLDDQDWLERLAENPDWKKLAKIHDQNLGVARAALEEIKTKIVSQPLTGAEVEKLRQNGLMLNRDVENIQSFMKAPAAEVERLREVRKQLPVFEQRIEQLKEQLGEEVARA